MSKQSYAPFGAVSSKSKKVKKSQSLPPGPGSYDISLPFIVPIVQTIKKKNNNVIVKLGHVGTAAFQNDQDRFKQENYNQVGPGQYNKESSSQKNKKQKRHQTIARIKLKQLIKQQPCRLPTISEVKQLQIAEYFQMPNYQKDVKSADDIVKQKVKGSIWSKFTQERDVKLRSVSNVGPGDYNSSKNIQKQKISSPMFKYGGVRSFFDQIYFETNKYQVAKQRQQQKYKSNNIGPGNYQLASDKKIHHKYQFFGSTQERKIC